MAPYDEMVRQIAGINGRSDPLEGLWWFEGVLLPRDADADPGRVSPRDAGRQSE